MPHASATPDTGLEPHPGLVIKKETSPSKQRKRIRYLRRKLKAVTKEHVRMAKVHGLYAVALTLTYPESVTPSGKEVSALLDKLRAKLKRKGQPLLYTWVLERSRAYHYHLMVWLPRDMRLAPSLLQRWWPHGHHCVEQCESVSRWSKYMAKSETKETLRAGVRIFGCGGLDDAGKDAVRFACLPTWLRRQKPDIRHLLKRRGGGWVDTTTGEIYVCSWVRRWDRDTAQFCFEWDPDPRPR